MGLDVLSWALAWEVSFPNSDGGESSNSCAVITLGVAVAVENPVPHLHGL